MKLLHYAGTTESEVECDRFRCVYLQYLKVYLGRVGWGVSSSLIHLLQRGAEEGHVILTVAQLLIDRRWYFLPHDNGILVIMSR